VYISPTIGTRLMRVDVMNGKTVVGSLAGWPQTALPKSEIRAYFNGLLADGKLVDEGQYSLRIKALRIFGDEEKEEDWDVYNTVTFSLTYQK
jgi:hypothetical protein